MPHTRRSFSTALSAGDAGSTDIAQTHRAVAYGAGGPPAHLQAGGKHALPAGGSEATLTDSTPVQDEIAATHRAIAYSAEGVPADVRSDGGGAAPTGRFASARLPGDNAVAATHPAVTYAASSTAIAPEGPGGTGTGGQAAGAGEPRAGSPVPVPPTVRHSGLAAPLAAGGGSTQQRSAAAAETPRSAKAVQADEQPSETGGASGAFWANTTQHEQHALYPRFMQCVLHGCRIGVPRRGQYVHVPCSQLLTYGDKWRRKLKNSKAVLLTFNDCRSLLTRRIGLPRQHPLVQWASQRVIHMRPQTSDWKVIKQARIRGSAQRLHCTWCCVAAGLSYSHAVLWLGLHMWHRCSSCSASSQPAITVYGPGI